MVIVRTGIWIVIAAILAGYVIHGYATLDRSDDRTQITSLIANAAKAAQSHNLGGAISCISINYKDESGMNYDRLRALAAQAMKNEPKLNVNAEVQGLQIKDDTSTLNLHLLIKRSGGESIFARNMTLVLKKENARHALVIPTKVWKITKAEGLGLNPTDAF